MALTQAALDTLLRWLDPDRERAAAQYEKIRLKLIKFFAWRGCHFPEDGADETIDRVARHLDEGEMVRASDPYTYVYGVAYNFSKEILKKQLREEALKQRLKEAAEGLPSAPSDPAAASQDEDRAYECMKGCLKRLSAEERQLLREYATGEKGVRIEKRKQMAARLKISPNALRIQCWRIREALHACKEKCLKQGLAATVPPGQRG